METSALTNPNETTSAKHAADPAWNRIQALSDELVETAESGDWTRLLVLENEWLESIKKYIVDKQAQDNDTLPVEYIESLLSINNDLYTQCKQAKDTVETNIIDIRKAKKGIKQVKEKYGEF